MGNCDQSYQAVLKAPFGNVGIVVQGEFLRSVDLLDAQFDSEIPPSGTAIQIAGMIRDYLRDPSTPLSAKLQISGSDFQLKVWRRLQQIPAGSVETYGGLAKELNTSARAIGNACRSNPCPLLIPCHRVVGKTGLGGFSGQYAGPKLEIKRWLLTHEGWL